MFKRSDSHHQYFFTLLTSLTHARATMLHFSSHFVLVIFMRTSFFCLFRSHYFEAMFRPGGMIESSKQEVRMERHDKDTFSRMLEFIYTGKLRYSAVRSHYSFMAINMKHLVVENLYLIFIHYDFFSYA